MPQLDKITYFTQFAWLCIFFGSFYLILVKHYLPRIARGLYVRSVLIKGENSATNNTLSQEIKKTLHDSLEITTQALSLSKNVLHEGVADSNKWRHASTNNTPLSSFHSAHSSIRVFHKEHLLSIIALKGAISPSAAYTSFPKSGSSLARSKYFQIILVRKLLKK
jgi:hypothetical protein